MGSIISKKDHDLFHSKVDDDGNKFYYKNYFTLN